MTSEMGELFNAWKQHKKDKKAANLEFSTELLEQKGIKFESKNYGIHLIIYSSRGIIDFWPSTGKWIHRNSKIPRRGVKRLLGFIGVEV